MQRQHFPHGVKMVGLAPWFKTSVSLLVGNYRPFHILICLSKVIEYVQHKQLYIIIRTGQIHYCLIATFRKQYKCQHVLIKLVGNCRQTVNDRQNVDDNQKVWSYVNGFKQGFWLPTSPITPLQTIQLLKGCWLLCSYLTNRAQHWKPEKWLAIHQWGCTSKFSTWTIAFFKCFYWWCSIKVQGKCHIYNCADDSTICFSTSDINVWKNISIHRNSHLMFWIESLASQAIKHYIEVIMTTMTSQITSLTVVYSTVYSDAYQRKHQSSASLAFVWGIHRERWIPRTKGQLCGKFFHLMTSSWNFKRSLWKLVNVMSLSLWMPMVETWHTVNALNYLAYLIKYQV